MKDLAHFKALILQNLSFYQWMNLPQILFEIDERELQKFPNVDQEILLSILRELEKEKLVKGQKKDGDMHWQRVLKSRRKNFRYWYLWLKDFFLK